MCFGKFDLAIPSPLDIAKEMGKKKISKYVSTEKTVLQLLLDLHAIQLPNSVPLKAYEIISNWIFKNIYFFFTIFII